MVNRGLSVRTGRLANYATEPPKPPDPIASGTQAGTASKEWTILNELGHGGSLDRKQGWVVQKMIRTNRDSAVCACSRPTLLSLAFDLVYLGDDLISLLVFGMVHLISIVTKSFSRFYVLRRLKH